MRKELVDGKRSEIRRRELKGKKDLSTSSIGSGCQEDIINIRQDKLYLNGCLLRMPRIWWTQHYVAEQPRKERGQPLKAKTTELP